MPDFPNIFQRINAVMAEVKYIQKESKSGMRYSIVSHDAVTSALHDSIVKHGIVYYPYATRHSQNGNRTEAVMVVRFVNMDDRDDFINVEVFGYGIDEQDKGPGKAISYAMKYALLKTFGLEAGDDPDQDQEAVHKPRQAAGPTRGDWNPGDEPMPVPDEPVAPSRPIRTADQEYRNGELEINAKYVKEGVTNGKPWTRIVDLDSGSTFFVDLEKVKAPFHQGMSYKVYVQGMNIISAEEL